MLVAQVHALSYATVAYAPSNAVLAPVQESSANSGAYRKDGVVRSQSTTPLPNANGHVLLLQVSPQTTPPLPAPTSTSDCASCSVVTQPTSLWLSARYQFPAVCGPRGEKKVLIKAQKTTADGVSYELYVEQNVRTSSGTISVNKQLQAGPDTAWVFYTLGQCQRQGSSTIYSVTGVPSINVITKIGSSPSLPTITQGPVSVGVAEGSTATFTATASGPATGGPLSYQWQRSNDGGASYANVPGATAASTSLTATLADNASLWRVVVSNSARSAAQREPARGGPRRDQRPRKPNRG
jgi:hypothetical protein